MAKIISDIGDWLISSGALVTIFVFAWKYVKPILQAKQKHAKTAHEREVLGLVCDLADMAVASQVSVSAPGHEKFDHATKIVNSALDSKGFKVQGTTVQHAIQAAYEKSDLTPSVNPSETPTTGVVVHG